MRKWIDKEMELTWKPEYRPSSHSVESRKNVLQSHKDSMSHVQTSSNIRRRHGKNIRFPSLTSSLFLCLFGIGLKAPGILPPFVNL